MRRIFLLLALGLAVPLSPCTAAELVDATGRTVMVPDELHHVLPAGRPAAVLLAALAPDLMIGWPHAPEGPAAELLPPDLTRLPVVPMMTAGRDETSAVAALHPDLILDYGSVGARYKELAEKTQAATGIPTVLLDGRLAYTPLALRVLGRALHREQRGEELARIAEGVLASMGPHGKPVRVVYVRGPDGSQALVPGGTNSETLEFLGWTLLAPAAKPGEPPGGSFRTVSVEDIAALDPDVVLFADPAMRAKVAASPEWRALRAVRTQHAWIAPSTPFGWIESPPSLNRLLGLAWLSGGEPHVGVVPLAAVFAATVYGRTPTPAQIQDLRASLDPIAP